MVRGQSAASDLLTRATNLILSPEKAVSPVDMKEVKAKIAALKGIEKEREILKQIGLIAKQHLRTVSPGGSLDGAGSTCVSASSSASSLTTKPSPDKKDGDSSVRRSEGVRVVVANSLAWPIDNQVVVIRNVGTSDIAVTNADGKWKLRVSCEQCE